MVIQYYSTAGFKCERVYNVPMFETATTTDLSSVAGSYSKLTVGGMKAYVGSMIREQHSGSHGSITPGKTVMTETT